jgi:hypothetical protein
MSSSSAKNMLSGTYDNGCEMQDVRSHDVLLINQIFMEFLVGCLVQSVSSPLYACDMFITKQSQKADHLCSAHSFLHLTLLLCKFGALHFKCQQLAENLLTFIYIHILYLPHYDLPSLHCFAELKMGRHFKFKVICSKRKSALFNSSLYLENGGFSSI